MNTVTIGFFREDGDFAILATLNNNDEHQGHGASGGVCVHSQGALYPYIVAAHEVGTGHPAAQQGKSHAFYAFYGDTCTPFCSCETAQAVAEAAKEIAEGLHVTHAQALAWAIVDAEEHNLFPPQVAVRFPFNNAAYGV